MLPSVFVLAIVSCTGAFLVALSATDQSNTAGTNVGANSVPMPGLRCS